MSMIDGSTSSSSISAGVPDGHDRDAVVDWAFGSLPFRDGVVSAPAMSSVLGSFHWRQFVGTRRFWADDVDVLHQATASLATAWWHLGAPAGLHASNQPGRGLDLRVGTAEPNLAPLVTTAGAHLIGSTLVDRGQPGAVPTLDVSVALWATPDDEGDRTTPGMLDRLLAMREVSWNLECLLIPVPVPHLRDRDGALGHLAFTLAGTISRQVQIDPLVTTGFDDPVAARLLDVVEVERTRSATMITGGAFLVSCRLSAPDSAQLAAVLGAVTGSEHNAGVHWHTLPLDGGGPLPATLLASFEAGDVLRPPARDTVGLPCRRWAALDEHPEPLTGEGPSILLGRSAGGAPLHVPLDSLCNHLLLTGASGSGKSSCMAWILEQLAEVGIPFWVIEPVKREYASLNVANLRVWSPGSSAPGQAWGLNPLEVPVGIAVSTHLDRLVELLRSAFGMPDPMPYLLETALQRAYERVGWDLASGHNLWADARAVPVWPTLSDVLDICLELPSEFGYEEYIQGNLRAAFTARLGGLLRGPRGALLDRSDAFPIAEATSLPTIINLDAIGDRNARAFIMGLLLMRLAEARSVAPANHLVHVTVVEEAHRLLGNEQPAQGESDPTGHTARAFSDLLAEIRATGEGVMIVDQSAGQLVRGALINTSTKVSLRTPDRADQDALGACIGLDPEHQQVFSGLGTHEALVSWEGMDAPVLAQVGARWLTADPPRPAHDHRPSARWSEVPPAVARAASLLIRVEDPTGSVRAGFDRAVVEETPDASNTMRDELGRNVLAEEVGRLGRGRRWDGPAVDAALAAVTAGVGGLAHPARLLATGRRPHLACRAVCPSGGCLTGELLEAEARALVAEGPASLTRMARDPEERSRRFGRTVLEVLPEETPTEMLIHATRCLTVKVFDRWADPKTVAGLIASMEEADG